MLIIFAESMVLFFNNLKSINGKVAFFSILTNRIREATDAIENIMICIKLFEMVGFSKS